MDLSIVPALIVLLVLLALVLLVWARTRSAPATVRPDDLYGPLPEDETERAEPDELPGGGQVTPGAVTPAWAGSSSGYYEAAGVGQGGPKHLSGPPPVASAAPAPSGPSVAEDSWLSGSDEESSGPNVLPLVAVGGGAVGLGIFVYLRRRARRKSRWQRLREGTRSVVGAAGQTASRLGDQAAELPRRADGRAVAGGGFSLALALAAFATIRRRQTERRRVEAYEAARVAALASSIGCPARQRASDLFRRFGARVAPASARTLPLSRRTIAVTAGGAILAIVAIRRIRRGRGSELDWTGTDVAESAPARETRS